jgi:undecaprenyl-diphosphatase
VYVLNTAIKQVVRRRRPELPDLPALTGTPTALSFPSAHASTAFAGARVYARMELPATPLYALATGLSLSRLYLGVHYPSDVLAGAALGHLLGRSRR